MLALISAFAFALGVVPTLVSGVGVAPTDGTLGLVLVFVVLPLAILATFAFVTTFWLSFPVSFALVFALVPFLVIDFADVHGIGISLSGTARISGLRQPNSLSLQVGYHHIAHIRILV